jgi:hypothetical protein
MGFWPLRSNTVEVLSESVKNVIASEVAEAVYQQLKTGKYVQDGYILEVANEIAKRALKIEFVAVENSDSFRFRIEARP